MLVELCYLCWHPLGYSDVESKKIFVLLQDAVRDWQPGHVVHGAAVLPVLVVAARTAPSAEYLRAVRRWLLTVET
jgi:hypothetical protein